MDKTWIKDGKFVKLSETEVKALTDDQLGAYMSDQVEDQVKSLIADSNKENVSKAALDVKVKALNEEIAKLNDVQLKDLNDKVTKLTTDLEAANKALTTQGTELTSLKETGKQKKEKPLNFREAVKQAILEKKDSLLKEVNDDYGKRLSMKDWFEAGNQRSPVFTIKSAVDMLESNIVQSEVNLVRLTDLDPNMVGIPLTIYPHVLDWMPSRSITKKNMSVMVTYSYTDGAGTKTEGSASGQSSFLLKTVEFPSFYIATYGTLSDETLDDLDEVLDEIAITFPSKILDKVDGYVLGTAGDDSTAIGGMFSASVTKHTDFATSTYTDTVENANVIDLISKAKLQMEVAKYMPNVVLMHPTDVDNLAALKATDDNSILDRRLKYDITGNPSMVFGMKIIKSTAITADTLAVIDTKQLIIGKRKEMTMEIGLNGTDLTEGQKTVVVKIRLAFGVRDAAGVIYSDAIETDVAAINKV